eukprot:COSAG06_NODE_631_length_13616_cov_6.997411_3_plen_131_part_00
MLQATRSGSKVFESSRAGWWRRQRRWHYLAATVPHIAKGYVGKDCIGSVLAAAAPGRYGVAATRRGGLEKRFPLAALERSSNRVAGHAAGAATSDRDSHAGATRFHRAVDRGLRRALLQDLCGAVGGRGG